MTTLERVDALARQLSAAERALLANRWLAEDRAGPDALSELDALIASVGTVVSGRRNGDAPAGEDPLWALGADPVDRGVTDASLPVPEEGGEDPIYNLGKYPVGGGDEDPIDGLGRNPVTTGVTDGSVAHDRYLYGSPPA